MEAKLPKKFKVILDPLYEGKVVEITPEQLLKKIEENRITVQKKRPLSPVSNKIRMLI